jgi:hypothetical protein
MRTFIWAAAAAGIAMAATSTYAIQAFPTVTDGDFSTWTSTVVDSSASSTWSNSRVATGGNPGAMFYASINASGDNLAIANIKGDYTNTNALLGSFSMKVDYLQADGDSPIMGVALVVKQGTKYWRTADTAVSGTATWQTATINGDFTTGTFVNFPETTTQSTPDFSAGVASQFGLLTYLNGSEIKFASNFDNWSLSNATLSVPEPASLSLLGLGGIAVLARRRRA